MLDYEYEEIKRFDFSEKGYLVENFVANEITSTYPIDKKLFGFEFRIAEK